MTPYPRSPSSHNGLKAFEAVARLMSFTLAAEELHVTQSAISRQIKQLEAEFNTSLHFYSKPCNYYTYVIIIFHLRGLSKPKLTSILAPTKREGGNN